MLLSLTNFDTVSEETVLEIIESLRSAKELLDNNIDVPEFDDQMKNDVKNLDFSCLNLNIMKFESGALSLSIS